MEQIIVTHKDGSTLKLQSRASSSAIISAVQNVEMLGGDTVTISVESATKLDFYLGDKVTIIGRDYTLNTPPREAKRGERAFAYELVFEGAQYDLLRAAFSVNVDTTSNAIQDLNGDSLTGDLKRFLDVLISNANRVFPGKWVLGDYPTETETRTESFGESDNCLTALQMLCAEDKYNTEFQIEINNLTGVRTLNVGSFGNVHGFTLQYGRGKGLYELTRQKTSWANIISRLHVYGSSNNINTSKYRAFRLCLPTKSKAQSYIEDAGAIAAYGVWEATKVFEEVYPHRTGTVSAIGANERIFTDSTMDFDLNAKSGGNSLYLIAGISAKVHFNTGNLAGYEFEVASYDHATKTFVVKPFTDENGYTFPSPTSAAFQAQPGDKYVLLDIYMPQSYVDAAEAELLEKGQEYLEKYAQPRVQYGLVVDRFFLKNIVGADAQSNIIWPGDYIPVKDTDLQVDKAIRVKGINRNLLEDYDYQVTIADVPVTVGTINRVVSDVNSFGKVVQFNRLNDPSRARRNYLSAQEVLDMVFDTEGDFYTDKIKPLSIDTTMLSVGAKSMQFGIEGVVFEPNYIGTKNRVVYSAGTLAHYAIVDSGGNPVIWNITGGDVVLGSDAAYYVYAKCDRNSAGASILFSLDKITAESDAGFYHFLIGILNSVGANDERAFALMYGFTTVNGRFIKTGRVQSADGETYFDLDTGELRGNFTFTSGVSVESAVASAIEAALQAGEDVAELDYLKQALQDGSTDISGGLLATNVLLLKTLAGAITGGMSGLADDNIGVWTGGTYQNALDNLAKIILRKDGSGQLAGGKINWDAAGAMNIGLFNVFNTLLSSGNISFTSDALENLADIPGSITNVTSPSIVVAETPGWSDTASTANFTLTKNSYVRFRASQNIVAYLADYATCYIRIKKASDNSVVHQTNMGKSVGASQSETLDISVELPAETYYLETTVGMGGTESRNRETLSISGYNGVGSTITVVPIATLTKIANNGLYSYWGSSAYMYLRTDFGFQVMFGSYGIQCTTAGLKKTGNGGSTWTDI